MAAKADCESPPAIQQPVAPNDSNNVISTMMSVIDIGRNSTRPCEATTVCAPAKRCRNASTQTTGRRTGIINSTHTANPNRVPSVMLFTMFRLSLQTLVLHKMRLQYIADSMPDPALPQKH